MFPSVLEVLILCQKGRVWSDPQSTIAGYEAEILIPDTGMEFTDLPSCGKKQKKCSFLK